MTIKEIITVPDEVLKKVSNPIEKVGTVSYTHLTLPTSPKV